MSGTVAAVLFDLDHTLYDRDRSFLAWAQWFVRNRLGLRDGTEVAEEVDLLVALDANGYDPKAALFRQIKERHPRLIEEVEALVAAFYEEHVAQMNVDEGASRLLCALGQAGVPWGIVTNGSRNQLLKIRKLGLDTLASCVVVSGLLGVRKPEPEIFNAAAVGLRIVPQSILFVGDNPETDIVGAALVGMQTAWLRRAREWPSHLAAHVPRHTIDSLTELLWIAETVPQSVR